MSFNFCCLALSISSKYISLVFNLVSIIFKLSYSLLPLFLKCLFYYRLQKCVRMMCKCMWMFAVYWARVLRFVKLKWLCGSVTPVGLRLNSSRNPFAISCFFKATWWASSTSFFSIKSGDGTQSSWKLLCRLHISAHVYM